MQHQAQLKNCKCILLKWAESYIGVEKMEFDQKCKPQGACKGCLWWTMSCVLSEKEEGIVEGVELCRYRESVYVGVKKGGKR